VRLVRTDTGSLFAAGIFNTAEAVQGLNSIITDGDKITKIEVYARRDNTTDAVSWDVEIVAMQIGAA
jgi:hypothetical protein